MKGQMNIFDLIAKPSEGIPGIDMSKYLNAPEPLCYDCQFAIRRGPFRLCQKGRKGYRKTGQEVRCKICSPTTTEQ